MAYGGTNPGINKLARVLSQRMKREGGTETVLDFGTVRKDKCLVTDTFPVAIPHGEYCILKNLSLKANDRVLVAWVGSEAVVVGQIK